MSESLHELEAALADAQREVATAEDSYTFRRARYDAKPTDKRHGRMLAAFHQRTDALHKFYRAQEAVGRARSKQAREAKEAEHPPLKEGLSTRVTDEDLATLRAEGQLFDVAAADAVDELDNPAAPIVEVDAPGRHRADEQSTPVVTLAPVNGEGRFVPTADVDLPVLEDTREWTALGTIADGLAVGATAYIRPVGPNLIGAPTDAPCPRHYCTERRNEGLPNAFPEAEQDERDEAEAELGYTRNEQGAYEYDGPVGEQPEVDFPDVGTPEWETVVRSLYGISEDTPIIPHKDFRSTATKIEPDVTVIEHAATPTGEKWRGMTLYVSDAVPLGSMFVFGEGSDTSAVTGPETFESVKAKLDAVRNVAFVASAHWTAWATP